MVLNIGSDIDSDKVLDHWVIGRTIELLVEPDDSVVWIGLYEKKIIWFIFIESDDLVYKNIQVS